MIPAQQQQQNSNQTQPTLTQAEIKRNTVVSNFKLAYGGQLETTTAEVYKKRLYDPIYDAVKSEFGLTSSAFFRSDRINKFRNFMKETAREQAYIEIDQEAKASSSTLLAKVQNSNTARKKAHGDVKNDLNTVMETKADSIVKKIVSLDKARDELVDNVYPRVNANQSEKAVVKEFRNSADKHIKTIADGKLNDAKTEAATIVDSVATKYQDKQYINSSEIDEQNADDTEKLVLNVARSANDKGKAAYGAIKKVEDPRIGSAFNKVSAVVRQLVPNVGDTAEAELELVIPLNPLASFIINMGASCEHDSEDYKNADTNVTVADQDYYSIGANINVGAQGQILGPLAKAALKGTVGMFMEAKGKTPEEAFKLISYGIYKVLYNKFPDFTARIWGNGGQTRFSKFEEAEMWALMVEKELTKDKNIGVSIGAQAKLAAEVETNDGFSKIASIKAEAELYGQKYYEFNQLVLKNAGIENANEFENMMKLLHGDERISRLLDAPNASQASQTNGQPPAVLPTGGDRLDKLLEIRKKKFKDNIHHKTKVGIEGETEFKFGDKAGFGVGLNGSLTINHGGTHGSAESNMIFEALELGVKLKFPESVEDSKVFNQLFPKLTNFASSLVGNVFSKAAKDRDHLGVVTGRESSTLLVNNALQGYVSSLKLDDTPFENAFGSDLSASLTFGFDFIKNEKTVELEVTRNQENKFDFEIVNFGVAKSQRLFKTEL